MYREGRSRTITLFAVALAAVVACFVGSVVKTNAYNRIVHHIELEGQQLFEQSQDGSGGVMVAVETRADTWTKTIDPEGEGITEPNYQAAIYDITVDNKTADEVSDFKFRLVFHQNCYLSSGWNGSIEVHQGVAPDERWDLVDDMRTFDPADHDLQSIEVDGEHFVCLAPEDYLVYLPSSSANAMEVPIRAYEATTPGFILYVPVDTQLDATLELDFSYHRLLTGEPLFWLSLVGFVAWAVAAIVFGVASAQIKRYQKRHEHDMEIINESIETFTGFIDAKDPYTHGHSKRVALYTRLIAEEMGYKGEELDRIYYIALLHDCGKIGVPDNVLGKPGRLTEEEFEVIKSHTTRGGEILSSFKSLKDVGEGALYHHERYDGHGYPMGLAGEDIPLIARMICVADSFDAMNSNRVYRRKLSRQQIIDEITNNRGTQFDPAIADIMLGLLSAGTIVIPD
jgi:hypothetical protein